MTDSLAAHLEYLERDLLSGVTRHDRVRLEALVAAEFREFGSSGRSFSREAILADLLAEEPEQRELTDFICVPVAENIALVTYRSTRHTATSDVVESLRSSLWIHRDGRWQMLFHQGTRIANATA